MKKFKHLLLITLCIATCILTVLGTTLSVAAAPSVEGYGTYEDGIIPNGSYYTGYHNPVPFEFAEFPNADFQKGLMYWTTCNGRKPTDNVTLKTEGTNVFIQIAAKEQYDGIESAKFAEDRIEVGDRLVTIYDWRGSEKHNIQVYINQYGVDNGRLTGSGSGAKLIKEAEGANGWNTSVGLPKVAVSEPKDGGLIFIGFGVQAFQDPKCTTQVDNVRIGKVDAATNDVYDLNGNFVCNLGPIKGEENKNDKDNNKDQTSSKDEKPSASEDTENSATENSKKNSRTNADVSENSNTSSTQNIIMIIIAVVAGLAIVAVVVVAVITRKKSKK